MRFKTFFISLIALVMVYAFTVQAAVNSAAVQKYVGMMMSANVTQSDLSGLGLPEIAGTWYFVDPTSGNDNYLGTTKAKAVKSFEVAYAKCTSGAGDGIVFYARGTTTAGTSAYLGTTLAWSKHGITVVGVCAPTFYNQRARITDSTGVNLTSTINITGNNNVFYNLSFLNSPPQHTVMATAVKISGGACRNAFINCDFKCTPDTASAFKTDLWLSNAHENYFGHCNFGNASYDAANNAACHIYIDGASGNAQNLFEDCTTIAQVSTGTAFGVLKSGAATSLNGTNIFKDCIFTAWQANAGVISLASWFIGTKPTTGTIIVDGNCMTSGYAKWDASTSNDRIVTYPGTTDGDIDKGIGVTP